MTTIHEKNGWQFRRIPDGGVQFSSDGINWHGFVHGSGGPAIHAYTELCPLPPDPPTLEHEGVTYVRDEDGDWLGDNQYSCWSDGLDGSLLDRIAKQGDYEDTE